MFEPHLINFNLFTETLNVFLFFFFLVSYWNCPKYSETLLPTHLLIPSYECLPSSRKGLNDRRCHYPGMFSWVVCSSALARMIQIGFIQSMAEKSAASESPGSLLEMLIIRLHTDYWIRISGCGAQESLL